MTLETDKNCYNIKCHNYPSVEWKSGIIYGREYSSELEVVVFQGEEFIVTTTAEAAILYILDFAKDRPAWQQDILRRLCTQSELQEQDYVDALMMLKAEMGLIDFASAPAPNILSPEHLGQPIEGNPPVRLLQLSHLENVGMIRNDQIMNFNPEGITLIYGDNGSGKSGYTRVSKKICRTRDDADEPIYPNAYETSTEPATAKVLYTVNGEQQELYQWTNGTKDSSPAALSQISVFDCKAAALYADEENRIDYVPFRLDVFTQLSQVCNEVVRRLKLEMAAFEKSCATPLPNGTDNTIVAKVFAKPTASSALATLNQLAILAPEEIQRIEDLGKHLADDPDVRIRHLERTKALITLAVHDVEKVLGAISPEALQAISEKRRLAIATRSTAELAAKNDFDNRTAYPIPGVGTEAWRMMFDYARQFSSEVFQEEPFPAPRSHDRCVLCHQELDEAASARLKRFDEYIKSTAEATAKQRESEWTSAKHLLLMAPVRSKSESANVLSALEAESPALFTALIDFYEVASNRMSAIREALYDISLEKADIFTSLPALPASPVVRLNQEIQSLTDNIQTLTATRRDPAILEKLKQEQQELQARIVLRNNLQIFQDRLQNLIELDRLKSCVKKCETGTISSKGTEARRLFMTGEFKARLDAEIAKLRMDRFPFQMVDHTDRGAHFIGMTLHKKLHNSDILSQGEQRALALSCFLAELWASPNHNGIIVDDPVSSLDHERRSLVAKRLVEEAKHRQVVIFTHDYVFFCEVCELALKLDVSIGYQAIRRNGEQCGFIDPEAVPREGKNIDQRIEELHRMLKDLPEDVYSSQYAFAIESLYEKLRRAWERLVEEKLFNKVVQRYEKPIKTERLKTVVVLEQDYDTIEENMTKVSASCHDAVTSNQRQSPTRDEAIADIKALTAFHDEIKARQKDINNRRESIKKGMVVRPIMGSFELIQASQATLC